MVETLIEAKLKSTLQKNDNNYTKNKLFIKF